MELNRKKKYIGGMLQFIEIQYKIEINFPLVSITDFLFMVLFKKIDDMCFKEIF